MGHHPQRRGLRILIGLAGLFSIFGIAAFWQQRNIAESRKIRDNAPDVLAARNEVITKGDEPSASPLPPGWGRVLLGRPSGAEPTPRPEPVFAPDPAPDEQGQDGLPSFSVPPPDPADDVDPLNDDGTNTPPPPSWPADQELKVRPGQSLSKIIATAYGRATPSLVERLARYNGMANADNLRIGQTLQIPVIEKLNELLPE